MGRKGPQTSDDERRFMKMTGKNVAEARKAHGWNRAAVARLLGVTYDSVAKKEQGIRGFTIYDAFMLANEFGISIEKLIFADKPWPEIRRETRMVFPSEAAD